MSNYRFVRTNGKAISEEHLPRKTRDPLVQTDADRELHKKAQKALAKWLKKGGPRLRRKLKKKK